MKKLPLGIQSFSEIIEGGYVYVDKTKYVYELANNAKHYFLSRPRRFGKSLLIDTIAAVFGGEKELFKGLFIYDTDYGFEKHPVLRLDMSNISSKTPEVLEDSLISAMSARIQHEGFDISSAIPSDMFKNLIEALSVKYRRGVVVLVDEYDKPILDHIDNAEAAEANRRVLRGFYGILKSMDPFLRLTFVTGVTKFTKTSLFSEMNNLFDITMTEDFSCICGIEVENLERYFGAHIESLASMKGFEQYGSIHDEILAWYDGYSWDGATRVINPFGLLSFFMQKRFGGYWYASGTPKFLVEMIKNRPGGYTDLSSMEIGEWSLDTSDIRNLAAGPLLFQTGYLTVKDVVYGRGEVGYVLGVPNYEVRLALNLHILSEFTDRDPAYSETAYRRIKESLSSGDLQSMLETLRALLASIPYQLHIGKEAYYHSIFLAILNALGFEARAEVSVSGGRIDATLELDDRVYVFELKYIDCAPDAAPEAKRALFDKALDNGLRQIMDRGYSRKFEGSGKAICHAAFVFLGRGDVEMRVC